MKGLSHYFKRGSTLAAFLLLVVWGFGQNKIVGVWKTIDDETNKAKSQVEIYEKDGKLYGKVIKLFREPDEEQDPISDKCDSDDPRYMKKVLGMEILQDLERSNDKEYEDGSIYDDPTFA